MGQLNDDREHAPAAGELSRPELLTELRAVQSAFERDRYNGLRLVIGHNADGKIVMLSIGPPDESHEPGVPPLTRSASAIVEAELQGLFARAGHVLDHLPNFGVVSPAWVQRISNASPGRWRWAAFLSTGPRLVHCRQSTSTKLVIDPDDSSVLWIDDIARVSASAIDDLISKVLAKEHSSTTDGIPPWEPVGSAAAGGEDNVRDRSVHLVLDQAHQSVHRSGENYSHLKPVPIRNDEAWKLLKHLVEDHGKCNTKSVKRVLDDEQSHARQNARRTLIEALSPFDLHVENWQLVTKTSSTGSE